ncbi:hypothetical protein IFM89_005725 [Coptis chinensis]|uniref:Uncharacterized protein n=1 Tax=Coptis chinensis TaxID=261450 RepID=A0A835IJQ9_9MAGN|nr:hypothetical protein IFM89_005725 [Coptis chinensis]
MSSKKWDSLPYNRSCLNRNVQLQEALLKHDENRFNEFLGKVERGEAKIADGAPLPHDIIKALNDGENDGGRVVELQWKRMVDDLLEKCKLHNCIAVCDVFGSMNGEPMEVCVALGLLLSELSEHPWNGQVITFSENPKLHKIEGGNLRSKTQFIRRMEAGYNTDFHKVFDLLLQVTVAGNLDKDKMIEKFLFSVIWSSIMPDIHMVAVVGILDFVGDAALGLLHLLSGYKLEVDSANNRAVVEGCGGQFPVGKESTKEVQLFLGNAGTAMHPLTAAVFAAGGNVSELGPCHMPS